MTRSETGFRAALAALTAKAGEANSPLVQPSRNGDLVSRLNDVGDDLSCHLNLLDDDHLLDGEMLGADLGQTAAYEVRRRFAVEWAVAGGTSWDRETRFDDGMQAVWDALKADMTTGSPVYLGGAADGLALAELIPHVRTNAALAGVPNCKSCVFLFEFTFTSPDPF